MLHIILLLASISWTRANECACATGDVNVRNGTGTDHPVLDVLYIGQCVNFTGHMLSAGSLQWASVQYKGKQGWIASKWLTFKAQCQTAAMTTSPTIQLNNGNTTGCPRIITRAEWSARAPSGHIGNLPALPVYVFIHHGASRACHTQTDCSAEVRSYQTYHMDSHGWSDIGYSFVVGEDGNVYEARGWNEIGAHTYGYNTDGLGICIIGDFTSHVPNDAALNAVKQLIKCGLDNGHISQSYTLKGHRDVGQTECPGNKLYQLIHGWPRYKQHGMASFLQRIRK